MIGYRGPSIDHSLLSPSGHMSKRAREAAIRLDEKRIAAWFARTYPEPTAEQRAETKIREEIASLRRSAADLRGLAGRGMSVRKFTNGAEKLEAQANDLEKGA